MKRKSRRGVQCLEQLLRLGIEIFVMTSCVLQQKASQVVQLLQPSESRELRGVKTEDPADLFQRLKSLFMLPLDFVFRKGCKQKRIRTVSAQTRKGTCSMNAHCQSCEQPRANL